MVPGATQVLTINVPGIQGPPGAFTAGTVTTGNPGTSASVATRTLGDGSQVVDFTIPRGAVGASNTLSIGTVNVGTAAATLTGTSPNQVLNLTLPQGPQGNTGPANTLSVSGTTTGAPGTNASVAISGTSPNQTLAFTIPRGDVGLTGPANTLTIGTVTTGASGSSASATVTGTAPNQILNLTIPQGIQGPAGSGAPDASTTAKGSVQLAGDLAGTASAPTVISGANHTHASSQISDATAAATANTLVMRNASGGASFGALTSASYQMGSDFAILPTAGSNSTASSFWGITLAGQRAANYTSASGVTMTGSSTTPHVYVPLSITTAPGLVIKAAASHTADLAQWQNSSSTVLAKVDAAGKLTAPTVFISGTQDTSVGAATRKDYVDAQVATRAAASHTHAISDLTATGTRDSTTYLRGDGTWAVPAGGAGGTVTAANITDATAIGRTVLTSADAAAVRTAIGAGTSSLVLGTAAGTAAAGNDSRLSDARTPTAHTHASAEISDSTVIGRTVLTSVDAAAVRTAIGAGTSSLAIGTTSSTAKAGNYAPPADSAAGTASMRTLGTGALQAAAGNDSRLSDARTPTAHTHTASQISDSSTVGRAVIVATDAAAARTAIGAGTSNLALGTTSSTAAAGDTVGRVTTLETYNKVLVLATGAPVPADTPANTVIFRTP